MESMFFHPKVVHVPMALGVLMPLVAGGFLLAWWRGWLPARAWIAAVALQAVLVVSGVTALRTGEAEEDRVEAVVGHDLIHEHEEAAEGFVWGSAVVLGLMVLALFTAKGKAGLPVGAVATAGTLLVLYLAWGTGTAGGALVYQHGAAGAYTQPKPPGPPAAHQVDSP